MSDWVGVGRWVGGWVGGCEWVGGRVGGRVSGWVNSLYFELFLPCSMHSISACWGDHMYFVCEMRGRRRESTELGDICGKGLVKR